MPSGVSVSVKMDVKAAVASLNDIARKQIPLATQAALNDIAFQVQRAEIANMASVFKSPRPFTAKSTQVDKATRANLTATVFVRPEVAKYLDPYEFGGVHVLPGPELLDPVNTSLDPYGQLRKGAVAKIAARKNVFFGTISGVSGFWLRAPRPKARGVPRGPLTLLLAFGNALPVKKRLHFHDRGLAVVRAAFPAAFRKALGSAFANVKTTP